MIPAALMPTTPDARSLPGRGSSDGAPQNDGFDAALAQAAPDNASAKTVTPAKTGTTGTTAAPASVASIAAVVPEAGGIAALLAKLASGATSVPVDGAATAAGKAGATVASDSGGESATSKSDKARDDAAVTASATPDPLASIAALLPGLVAGPAAAPIAAAATTAKAPSDPAKLSFALGDASIAKTIDGSKRQPVSNGSGDATTAGAEPSAGFIPVSSVASATHLAPVTPAATPAIPHASATTTTDAPKPGPVAVTGDASAPSAAAKTDAASPDAAPAAAVATHDPPVAGLPNGTLQAIAGAVTSLAADTAPASSTAAQSAPAAPADPTPASLAPARSLTLQLNPENLGSVTVQLHLTAGGLDVRLAVDDRKTLASISHARDELAQAIGDNGYRVESLVIRGSDASSTSTAGSNDSARSQSEAGAGQGFSGGGTGGSGGDAPSSRQRGPQASAGSRDPARDRGNDGVFV